MEAEINLKYQGEKTAEAIAKAVSPDNFKSPPGLSIETHNRENLVVTNINCNKMIPTLLATIDDFLSCVTTAERTLQATKKMG